MPEIDKSIWANHNISPEGGVSAELLMSQMQTEPAKTIAPDQTFFSLIQDIQEISKTRLKNNFFREHSFEEGISKRIHRFQSVTLEGFYLLCKEITRYVIERLDTDLFKQLKKETENLGSLKRLENILTALGYDGRQINGVLVGVYDLRMADAHLPSDSKIADSMRLAGINYDEMRLHSGKRLIENVNHSLAQIKVALKEGDFDKLRKQPTT